MEFRYLRADEIDVRVGTVNKNGCSLLLYKDARCDMNILDESVGKENWKREHLRDNANCIVSIWDDNKKQWVGKEDVGVESYTEKEKGLASDSFKRACVNWGIGRELYTSPFIWVENYVKEVNGKLTVKERFYVKSIEVTNGVITQLTIVNSSDKTVFTFASKKQAINELVKDEEQRKKDGIKCINELVNDPEEMEQILEEYHIKGLQEASLSTIMKIYKELKNKK